MDYSQLSGVECRLLLVYRDDPDATKEAFKLSAGIKQDHTFYSARKKLRELGLLDDRPTNHTLRAIPKTITPQQPFTLGSETQGHKIGRIHEVYASVFNIQATMPQLQQLLNQADVETVIEVISKIKGRTIERPFPYVMSILKQAPKASPQQPKVPAKGAEAWVPGQSLPEPSDEFLKTQARLAAIKVEGWESWD